MRISKVLIDEMVTHAQEDVPNECCGLIGGRDGEATRVYRARNEFASPLRYKIDTKDQLRIQEHEMREAGEEVVGIYHSHTKSPSYPSQTDLNEAVAWPEPIYFIVSLQDPDAPVVNGFWLRDNKISDAKFDVV